MRIAFVNPVVCRNLGNETSRDRAAVATEHPEFRALRKLKTAAHHSHDGVWRFIYGDRPAYYILVGTKPSLPQSVADQHHVSILMLVVVSLKRSPELGARAKQAHEIRCDGGAIDAIGLAVAGKIEVPIERRRHVLESLILRAPVDKVSGRHGTMVTSRHRFPQRHQAIRVRIRQRPEHDSIYHTEDRSISPN